MSTSRWLMVALVTTICASHVQGELFRFFIYIVVFVVAILDHFAERFCIFKNYFYFYRLFLQHMHTHNQRLLWAMELINSTNDHTLKTRERGGWFATRGKRVPERNSRGDKRVERRWSSTVWSNKITRVVVAGESEGREEFTRMFEGKSKI